MKAYIDNIAVTDVGQFSSEFQVQYYNHLGKVISGFFDKKFLKDGRLEVKLMCEINDEFSLVMAPQTGFLEYGHNILCHANDLSFSLNI